MFELKSRQVMRKRRSERHSTSTTSPLDATPYKHHSDQSENDECLHLKGQMRFIPDWDAVIFLATPILSNMEHMHELDLFINDLSMHDVSRDLVMLGTERSKELKSALEQQKSKSRKLEEMMELLEREMKRTDQLLYQMIPPEVVDSLRSGQPAMSTCRMFESVTILFSEVEGFTEISMKIKPLEVVSLLNAMYTKFDSLTEKHRVYKVETIADSYMVVGGAPTETPQHAAYVCDMALEAMTCVSNIGDPSDEHKHLQIRIGIHSGAIVAGVVGMKMPRYCLFGDTVNTSSRMMSTGQAMKIQVSQSTMEQLGDLPYRTEHRGTVQVKGKGEMKTYWLTPRKGPPTDFNLTPPSCSDVISSNSTLEQICKSHLSMQSLLTSPGTSEVIAPTESTSACSILEAMVGGEIAGIAGATESLERDSSRTSGNCPSYSCCVS